MLYGLLFPPWLLAARCLVFLFSTLDHLVSSCCFLREKNSILVDLMTLVLKHFSQLHVLPFYTICRKFEAMHSVPKKPYCMLWLSKNNNQQ